MNLFWSGHQRIASEMEEVVRIIKEVNRTGEALLDRSVDYMTASGGKMLRPGFFMIGSRFGQNPDDDKKQALLNLAAAIENLHMATLIHDDVIDEARLRRGKETIQSRYGKEYAVYMGDYMLCQCFIMLSGYPYDRETLSVLARGVTRICVGEMRQYQNRNNINLNIHDYKKIIAGKTAALFAVSLFLGAWESRAPEAVSKNLAKLGFCAGMAFQISDDLLDYKGVTEVLGKEILTDLRQGLYTLPLILGIRGSLGREVSSILRKSSIDMSDAVMLRGLLESSGALDEAQQTAEIYIKKAYRYFDRLPECEGKVILSGVLPQLLQRTM